MPGGQGYRARTRDAFSRGYRQKGYIHLTTYLTTYKLGDYVDIKVNGAVHKVRQTILRGGPSAGSAWQQQALAVGNWWQKECWMQQPAEGGESRRLFWALAVAAAWLTSEGAEARTALGSSMEARPVDAGRASSRNAAQATAARLRRAAAPERSGGCCSSLHWHSMPATPPTAARRPTRHTGHAAQVLPRQDWPRVERHQARSGRGDAEAGAGARGGRGPAAAPWAAPPRVLQPRPSRCLPKRPARHVPAVHSRPCAR